jgi:MFS family permease
VLTVAGLACIGTLTLAASPVFRERPATGDRSRYRLFRGTRLALYVGIGFVLTVAFNMCDIAVVAFVSGRHATPAAGIVLAVWSLGSLVGGLLLGGRGAGSERSLGRGCLAIGIGVAAAAASPGRVGLALVLFAGGALIAPGLARLYATVATTVPERAATEAFSWVGVGLLAGSSVGAAVGGVTVDALGARPAFLLASVLPVALGLLLAVGGRSGALVAAERLAS